MGRSCSARWELNTKIYAAYTVEMQRRNLNTKIISRKKAENAATRRLISIQTTLGAKGDGGCITEHWCTDRKNLISTAATRDESHATGYKSRYRGKPATRNANRAPVRPFKIYI